VNELPLAPAAAQHQPRGAYTRPTPSSSTNTVTASKPARSQLVPVLYVTRLLRVVACASVNPSITCRGTSSKKSCKERGNPVAKEASGEARH